MRLLNAHTLEFEEFYEDHIKPYAILSHRWGNDEVTFQSFQIHENRLSAGYTKVTRACEEALKQKLDYVWIDTCCIDKTSSAEMTKSINSMFKWYQMADICFAYLDDVDTTILPDGIGPGPDFETSLWFSRGWTLQELLAPKRVLFYGSDWNISFKLGNVVERISKITGIMPQYLLHTDPKVRQSWIDQASVAEKMNWAALRETTVPEDMAYCLLGIFGVTMPIIYGEGKQAFIRLQEQIIRRRFDPTLFAWNTAANGQPIFREDSRRRNPIRSAILSPSELNDNTWGKGHALPKVNQTLTAFTILVGFEHPWCHMRNGYVSNSVTAFLAESPKAFRSCNDIVARETTVELSLTSKGSIIIQLPVSEDEYPYMVLPCGIRGDAYSLLALPLVPGRGGQYNRAVYPVKVISHNKWLQWPMKNVNLVSQSEDLTSLSETLRNILHIGELPPGYELSQVYPGEAWSPVNMTISLPFVPTGEWDDTPAAVLLLKSSGTNTSFAISLKARQPRLISISANFRNFGSMHIDHDLFNDTFEEDLVSLYEGQKEYLTYNKPQQLLRIASVDNLLGDDEFYVDITRQSLTGSQLFSINFHLIHSTTGSRIRAQYTVVSALLISKFFHYTDMVLRPGSFQPHIPWNTTFLVTQLGCYWLWSSYFHPAFVERIGYLAQWLGGSARLYLARSSWGLYFLQSLGSLKMGQEISVGMTIAMAIVQCLPLLSILAPSISNYLRRMGILPSMIMGILLGEILCLDGFLGLSRCRALCGSLLLVLQMRASSYWVGGMPYKASGNKAIVILLVLDFLLSPFMVGLGGGTEQAGHIHDSANAAQHWTGSLDI